MRLGDPAAQMNVETIPTGSLSLDLALGLGGIPKGRIVEIYGCNCLVKGGHMLNDRLSSDVLATTDGKLFWYESERVDNPNTHGTGCTLSSAIASYMALGCDIQSGVKRAKEYLDRSIREQLDLGSGHGPLWHVFA